MNTKNLLHNYAYYGGLRMFTEGQLFEIYSGLEQNLDVSVYAKVFLKKEEMRTIRMGLEHNIDVSEPVITGGFNSKQLEQIQLGIEEDVDVLLYAKKEYNATQMMDIRNGLVQSKSNSISSSYDASFIAEATSMANEIMSGFTVAEYKQQHNLSDYKYNALKDALKAHNPALHTVFSLYNQNTKRQSFIELCDDFKKVVGYITSKNPSIAEFQSRYPGITMEQLNKTFDDMKNKYGISFSNQEVVQLKRFVMQNGISTNTSINVQNANTNTSFQGIFSVNNRKGLEALDGSQKAVDNANHDDLDFCSRE